MIVVIEPQDIGRPIHCQCGVTYQVNGRNAPSSRKPRAAETKPRNLRKWTEKEKAEVVRKGMPGVKEMAKKYKSTYSAIQSIIFRAKNKKAEHAR